jgi:K+-sensing histidine kinase KdpD
MAAPGHPSSRTLHAAGVDLCEIFTPLAVLGGRPGRRVGQGRLARYGLVDGEDDGGVSGRGELRIYLGAAPGVGKTYAMLGEARRRRERGTDVVVGVVDTRGRARTAELLDGLELLPCSQVDQHGRRLGALDMNAVLTRRPEVVLVDDLAHTNPPGPATRNAGRTSTSC